MKYYLKFISLMKAYTQPTKQSQHKIMIREFTYKLTMKQVSLNMI